MADDWGTDLPPELMIGTPGSGLIDISSRIPPELTNFYMVNYSATVARVLIRFEISPVNLTSFIYYYMIALSGNALGGFAQGWVDSTSTVHETSITFWTNANPTITNLGYGVHSPVTISHGANAVISHSGDLIEIEQGARLQIENGGSLTTLIGSLFHVQGTQFVDSGAWIELVSGGSVIADSGGVIEGKSGSFIKIDVGAQYFIDGNSAPRGFVDYGFITGSVAPIGTAFTSVVLSSVPTIYRNGRAYELRWKGSINPSANVSPHWQLVQQGNGNVIILDLTLPATTVTGNQEFGSSAIFVNDTGADITDQIELQLKSGTAGVTITPFALPTYPFYFRVLDIGSSADYPFSGNMV